MRGAIEQLANAVFLETNCHIQRILAGVTKRHPPKGHVHLYLAGPPCQDFSSAGKRQIWDNPRSLLYLEPIELIIHNNRHRHDWEFGKHWLTAIRQGLRRYQEQNQKRRIQRLPHEGQHTTWWPTAPQTTPLPSLRQANNASTQIWPTTQSANTTSLISWSRTGWTSICMTHGTTVSLHDWPSCYTRRNKWPHGLHPNGAHFPDIPTRPSHDTKVYRFPRIQSRKQQLAPMHLK